MLDTGTAHLLRAAQSEVAIKTKLSADPFERAQQWIPSAVTSALRYHDPCRIFVQAAKGGRIWDAGGNEYLDKVTKMVPGADVATFCSSGSEATLHTLRLARGYTRRNKIAKFEGGYHRVHDTDMVGVQYRQAMAGPLEAPMRVPDSLGIPEKTVTSTVILPFNHRRASSRERT